MPFRGLVLSLGGDVRPFWIVLALAAFGLTACDDGDDDLEPVPAAETAPGAAEPLTVDPWDADEDGELTREEYEAWWAREQPYADWDVNADAVVTTEELARGVFNAWDVDRTGGVDPDEWGMPLTGIGGGDYPAWEEWDRDADQMVVADELAEGFQRYDIVGQIDLDEDRALSEDELRAWWFDLLDVDDDGVIDRTEWRQASSE